MSEARAGIDSPAVRKGAVDGDNYYSSGEKIIHLAELFIDE